MRKVKSVQWPGYSSGSGSGMSNTPPLPPAPYLALVSKIDTALVLAQTQRCIYQQFTHVSDTCHAT